MKSWMAAAAALFAMTLTTACGDREDTAAARGLQTAARRGEEVFYKHCAVCHSADTDEVIVGPSLRGFFNRPPTPLADGTLLPRTDAAVRELFDKGTRNMPPVRGLSEQQLSDVIAFLHTI